MATATPSTIGIDWIKVARWTLRCVWATLVLVFKVSVILVSLLASLVITLCASRRGDIDNHEEETNYGIPANSFERRSPINKYAPYD